MSNQIAQTILQQLGGNRFAVMTGAKNFIDTGDGLSFKLGRNESGITHVTITLTPDDLYTVRFQRVWGHKVTEKGTTEGVYNDMLRNLISSKTGLALSL